MSTENKNTSDVQEKIRILVLTSSTGGGHDARAQAFAEWCYQLYPASVDVRIEQMLEKSSIINRGGVGFYNWIQKKIPALHTAFYTFVEGLSFLNRNSVTLGRGYYKKVLHEYQPHLIFSVHDCLNRGYFQLARSLLGAANVRCATYCGEFSGGWGYSTNWIEPTADLYISRTETARDYAVKKGMPLARTSVRGHFMRPSAHLEEIDAAQRARARKKRYGLHPDRFTIFLATGSNGANNHRDLLSTLTRYADRCQAIIICGRNRDAYNDLVRWRMANPDFHCYVEGFSGTVHLLMQAADVIVTRGGTTTCAQALHFRCPIIFNGFGGVMPQEMLTLKYFSNGAGSHIIKSAVDFSRIIDDWMKDPSAYKKYREAFVAARYEEDPTKVIDELVALAHEAAPNIPLPVRQKFPPANGNGDFVIQI